MDLNCNPQPDHIGEPADMVPRPPKMNDTPTPKTDAVEHDCNRLPIVMGFLKMRDHAKEQERQLQQTKDALHATHKDRLADAAERRKAIQERQTNAGSNIEAYLPQCPGSYENH